MDMKDKRIRVGAILVLLSAAQPAWALGPGIVEGMIALVVGGPALLFLLFRLVRAAKDRKADPASQNQLVLVGFWGALFNSVWLWLLYTNDPDTFGSSDGWSKTTFVLLYLFPNAALVAFLLIKGWARRAAAVMVICLLTGCAYWVLS